MIKEIKFNTLMFIMFIRLYSQLCKSFSWPWCVGLLYDFLVQYNLCPTASPKSNALLLEVDEDDMLLNHKVDGLMRFLFNNFGLIQKLKLIRSGSNNVCHAKTYETFIHARASLITLDQMQALYMQS